MDRELIKTEIEDLKKYIEEVESKFDNFDSIPPTKEYDIYWNAKNRFRYLNNLLEKGE